MKNPLVVGYRGEIGSYILTGLINFLPSAIPIKCVDVHDNIEEVRERIVKCDVIFLCIPLDLTAEFLLFWNQELSGKVVIEQTSLKGALFTSPFYLKNKKLFDKIDIRSIHILFRPSITDNFKDRTIILIGDKEFWCTRDLTYFFNKGLNVDHFTYLHSWEEHDAEMALQQALVHRVLLVLGSQVSEGSHYEKNTYISRQVLRLSQRIKEGDYDLYAQIQQNPEIAQIVNEFTKNLLSFDIKNYMKKKG